MTKKENSKDRRSSKKRIRTDERASISTSFTLEEQVKILENKIRKMSESDIFSDKVKQKVSEIL